MPVPGGGSALPVTVWQHTLLCCSIVTNLLSNEQQDRGGWKPGIKELKEQKGGKSLGMSAALPSLRQTKLDKMLWGCEWSAY